MNESMKNPKAWIGVVPNYFNRITDRSPANYIKALNQFEVSTNPRYVRGHDGDASNGNETYCNIYLWDGTTALDCEIPHWVDVATGLETAVGKGKELSANGVCDWLATHGLKFGWMTCDEMQARKRASAGYPTVVTWRNTGGIGHVGFILPGSDFTHLSQAGAKNFMEGSLLQGFGGVTPLKFYTHD